MQAHIDMQIIDKQVSVNCNQRESPFVRIPIFQRILFRLSSEEGRK